MRRHLPGLLHVRLQPVQIAADGTSRPCAYATDGELVFGKLERQDFDEIWNGPNAQDLRRAMLTWDYPSLCNTCWFTDTVAPPRGSAVRGRRSCARWGPRRSTGRAHAAGGRRRRT